MPSEVKSLVKLCASSITKTIQTSKFTADLPMAKRQTKYIIQNNREPITDLLDCIFTLIGISAICIKKTIEYGLYGKFESELSATERESKPININSEWISDPLHKLVECFVEIGANYIKKTIENRKLDLSAMYILREEGDEISLSHSSLKRKFKPFHELPNSLLEEIIESLTGSQKPTDLLILNNLITPQRQHLSFSVYSDDYLNLFPKLGNLLELKLENTAAGYYCLKSIGIYCSKLRSLNLKNCVNVTDNGIQCLFGGVDYPELGTGKAELCGTLQKLNICSTSVTQRGIQMALKYLLALKIIEHKDVFENLVKLAQSAVVFKRGKNKGVLSLSVLCTTRDKPYVNDSLQFVLFMCNSINLITIYLTKGLKDRDLLCIMSVKTLRGLRILKSPTYAQNEIEITFEGGLLPLLRVIGKSLIALCLYCFDSVRISAIAESCPNLTHLYINNYTGLVKNELNIFKMRKKPPVFQELTYLYCVRDIPYDILLFLLSSPLLESIGFYSFKTLTFEVLKKAANEHQFKELKKLDLEKCNKISERRIIALLSGNNLKEICVKIH